MYLVQLLSQYVFSSCQKLSLNSAEAEEARVLYADADSQAWPGSALIIHWKTPVSCTIICALQPAAMLSAETMSLAWPESGETRSTASSGP